MPVKNTSLVLSALGRDRPGVVSRLSRAILDAKCNIQDARMAVLSGEFAILLAVDGPWNKLARFESQLPELQKELGLTIITERAEVNPDDDDFLPYGVDVVTLDRPGILHSLTSFFATHQINIQDMTASSYTAMQTGTRMSVMHMTIAVPARLHIAALREEFMDFCDHLNIDAVLDPVKG